MKIKNNEGFTLVELIVAISILGIVLTLGYGIINGYSRSMESQKHIFNIQSSINHINTYLTKDLEQARDFFGPLPEERESDQEYLLNEELQQLVNEVDINNSKKYVYKIITKDDEEIFYEIVVMKSAHNYEYKIIRKASNTNIEILFNQPTYIENTNVQIPFIIDRKGLTYYIDLWYEQYDKPKSYRFSASSRYL